MVQRMNESLFTISTTIQIPGAEKHFANPYDTRLPIPAHSAGTMRLLHCALVIGSLSSSLAAAGAEQADIAAPHSLSYLRTDDQTTGRASRFLETGNTEDRDGEDNLGAVDEDRVGPPGLPQIEGLGAAVVSKAKVPEEFKFWLKVSFSMDETFKILKLDDEVDKLFANPQLNTWVAYSRLVGEKTKDTGSPVITNLTQRYGAAKLSEAIETAKKSAFTRKIAQELQDLQLKQWLDAKTDPKIVFSLLGLNMSKSVLESSPNVPVFAKYIEKFNELYGKT